MPTCSVAPELKGVRVVRRGGVSGTDGTSHTNRQKWDHVFTRLPFWRGSVAFFMISIHRNVIGRASGPSTAYSSVFSTAKNTGVCRSSPSAFGTGNCWHTKYFAYVHILPARVLARAPCLHPLFHQKAREGSPRTAKHTTALLKKSTQVCRVESTVQPRRVLCA